VAKYFRGPKGGRPLSDSYPYEPGGRFNLQFKINWEALRRHPEFRRDCDSADSPEDKANIARKWGLRELFDYDDPLWDPKATAYPRVFTKRLSPVIVLYGAKLKGIIDKHARVPLSRNLHLFENRFLPLLIDLSFPKEVITQDFNNMLDSYLPLVEKPSKRKSIKPIKHRVRGYSLEFNLDEEPQSGPVTIFQVWDINKKDNKSPWEIAQELYPQLKGTSYRTYSKKYDTNARRLQKQIADAITRAQTIIDSITPAR
jgi:hypothetical protein